MFANLPLGDLLTGIKSIGVRLKGKKSDNSLEDIKTNDNGALKVDGAVTLTGPDGNPLSTTSGELDVRASEIEALLNTLGGKDFATQTTLAAILAKIISAPATEAKQDTLIAKDFATQTTLAAILAKLSADPATQTTLAAILAALQGELTTTLTGSIEEHLWLSTDPESVPVSNRALGVVIDVATNEMTTKYWDGTSWEEVR